MRRDLWVSFGINHLLRNGSVEVPAFKAASVQRAALEELGVRTYVGRGRNPTQRKIWRAG